MADNPYPPPETSRTLSIDAFRALIPTAKTEGPSAAPQGARERPRDSSPQTGTRLPLLALVLGVLGSGLGLVLPWVSGLVSINGYEIDDAKIVLGAFVIGVVLLLSVRFGAHLRVLGIALAVVGLAPLAVGTYYAINIERALGENAFAAALFSTGIGVWLTALSGAVWVAAGFLVAARDRRSR